MGTNRIEPIQPLSEAAQKRIDCGVEACREGLLYHLDLDLPRTPEVESAAEEFVRQLGSNGIWVRGSAAESSSRARRIEELAAEYAYVQFAHFVLEQEFLETGRPELELALRESQKRVVATRVQLEAANESAVECERVSPEQAASRAIEYIVTAERRKKPERQPHRVLQCRQEPATTRTTGDRDTVRRARPRRGARPSGKGDGDADPEATARDFVSLIQAAAPLLVAPLTRLLATPPPALVQALTLLSAPRPSNRWVHQRDSPFPTRIFTHACREHMVRGDDRAAVRGRVHYMRQTLIDEILRGTPQPKKASNKVAPEAHLSPLESLRRDFDLAVAEAAE